MRKIDKDPEPKSWCAYRNTKPTPKYEDSDTKELREALIEEQGYLCAYCQRRISLESTVTSTKIEHIKCQSGYPKLQLDYNNMVLCCNGLINNESHCDTAKGDKDIHFDLFSQSDIDCFYYSSHDGSIKSQNPTFELDINQVLNLNHPLLKKNRLEVLKGIIQSIEQRNKKRGDWKKNCKKELQKWESKTNGKFREYNGIVIWFLRKSLR